MRYHFLSTKKNCPDIWGPDLRREPIYACSCLAFCALGVSILAYGGQLQDLLLAGGWPHVGKRLLLVHGLADILQGFLSLASDVVLVDVPSVLHLADRVLAVLLTAIGIYVEVCVLLFAQLQASHQLLMLALLVGGLAHHFRAKAAIRKRAH